MPAKPKDAEVCRPGRTAGTCINAIRGTPSSSQTLYGIPASGASAGKAEPIKRGNDRMERTNRIGLHYGLRPKYLENRLLGG